MMFNLCSFYIPSYIPSYTGSYSDPFHYYSIWNILLLFLTKLLSNEQESFWYTFYPLLRNISFWTAFQCSLVGFYITYIYPRSYHVFYLQPPLVFKQSPMMMMDVLAHHLPFLWITTNMLPQKTSQTSPTSLPLILTTSYPTILLLHNLPLLVYSYFLHRTYSSIGKGLNFIYRLRNYDIIFLSVLYSVIFGMSSISLLWSLV
jgi:hypothetical protein